MKRVVIYSLALVFGLLTSAIAAEKVSPTSVSGAKTVDTAAAKALFDKGAPFVDVRNNKDWDAGRVPGAVHVDLHGAFNAGALEKVAKKDKDVVIYCNGPSCMRSSEAAAMAVGWGFAKVHYYRDGFPAWKGAGYPVE